MNDGFDFDGDDDLDSEATCVRMDPLVTTRTATVGVAKKKSPLNDPSPRATQQAGESVFSPGQPKSIAETGLSPSYIEELCLKHLFQAGELQGSEITRRLCLPSALVEKVMSRLHKSKYVEIKGTSGGGVGRSGMIFAITSQGLSYVEHAMERDRYVGPAPIPFEQYLAAVAAQTIRGNNLQLENLLPNFQDLVLNDDVFDAIGPAMNSAQALFFYGPPGNGKTAICQRMTNCFGGAVFIPYSIIVDDFIIKIFDETIHKPTDDGATLGSDARWVHCHRPMVVVGGELMLDDLDLSYSSEVKYYEAPFQMKANNGMLLIDDFGRQKVSPKDLLNRWIVPLESEMDFLSMHTGKKLQVPFDVFVTFSTNLDPKDLVDAAFMRRVPYKLEVQRPDLGVYKKIFIHECNQRAIPWDEEMFEYLIETHYEPKQRALNACEPRDLLKQVVSLCSYMGTKPHLAPEIIDRVVDNYFVQFE